MCVRAYNHTMEKQPISMCVIGIQSVYYSYLSLMAALNGLFSGTSFSLDVSRANTRSDALTQLS